MVESNVEHGDAGHFWDPLREAPSGEGKLTNAMLEEILLAQDLAGTPPEVPAGH